jgi:hypothetical protein
LLNPNNFNEGIGYPLEIGTGHWITFGGICNGVVPLSKSGSLFWNISGQPKLIQKNPRRKWFQNSSKVLLLFLLYEITSLTACLSLV